MWRNRWLALAQRRYAGAIAGCGTLWWTTSFSATQLFAMACEKPEDYGRPIATPRELADEMSKQGIVATISPRMLDD